LNKPITFDKSTGKGMTDVVILWKSVVLSKGLCGCEFSVRLLISWVWNCSLVHSFTHSLIHI